MEGKEFDAFMVEYVEKAGKLADRFKDYRLQFPGSTNAPVAWENWMRLLEVVAQKSPARRAELEAAEQQGLVDPKFNSNQRSLIRNNQVRRVNNLAEREKLVRQMKDKADNPGDFFCLHMLKIAMFTDYPHSLEIVDEILKLAETAPSLEEYRATGHTSTNERAYKDWSLNYQNFSKAYQPQALKLKKQLGRIGQPLQLQFTALDGSKIDLQNYRGKVVLLDFWSTWCPPCVAGLRRVKPVWEKFHPDGFEIVGISYDKNREDLEAFVKKNGLPWPQFFDPAGQDASLAESLGQPGPPAYWLINRQGQVSDLNGLIDLEAKVKRLLELGEAKPKP